MIIVCYECDIEMRIILIGGLSINKLTLNAEAVEDIEWWKHMRDLTENR